MDRRQVIRAYRSQFVIEEIFHEMKDRHIGSWWPLHHWTDSKIQVHGLYCTIAVLLRALLWRRVRQAGLKVSMKGLLDELEQIQQVINFFPGKHPGQSVVEQPVPTRRNATQDKLVEILGLNPPKVSVLGHRLRNCNSLAYCRFRGTLRITRKLGLERAGAIYDDAALSALLDAAGKPRGMLGKSSRPSTTVSRPTSRWKASHRRTRARRNYTACRPSSISTGRPLLRLVRTAGRRVLMTIRHPQSYTQRFHCS